MCKTDGEIYLPVDLGFLINYIDKRQKSEKIRQQIKFDKLKDMNDLTYEEIPKKIHEEVDRFIELLCNKENKIIEEDISKRK